MRIGLGNPVSNGGWLCIAQSFSQIDWKVATSYISMNWFGITGEIIKKVSIYLAGV
jgi:hypothetical protein